MTQEIEIMLAQAQQHNAELQDAESRWRFALEGAGDGVWDWHVQAGILHLSKRWKEMLGYTEEEIGSSLDEWINRIHAEDLPRAMEGIKTYLNGQTHAQANEYRMQCRDGSYKWILTRGMVVSRDVNNIPERIIGTNADITERKFDEETIQHQANFDALTQLPNRRLFYDRLEQEIRKVTISKT
jgi:PAS domain S-box-containing protein